MTTVTPDPKDLQIERIEVTPVRVPLDRVYEGSFYKMDDAVKHGARLVGGVLPDDDLLKTGPYMQPTLLIDPPSQAIVRSEETFGPVLTIIPVDTDEEAIRVANETPYGLGASVWGRDEDRCTTVAKKIDAGYYWINALARVYDELPFGKVKDSGFGREHGTEALDSYLEDHTVIIGAKSLSK